MRFELLDIQITVCAVLCLRDLVAIIFIVTKMYKDRNAYGK